MKFFLIIIFLIPCFSLLATKCDFGDVYGQSAFKFLDPYCDTLINYLYIDLDPVLGDEDRITDLSPLKNIKTIIGDLVISGETESLKDFSGLENLQTITGDLIFKSVRGIKSFKGFENLQTINGDLIFEYVEGIKNLKGFESLSEIGDVLELRNTKFESLSGLSSLKSIGRYVILDRNENLVDIQALKSDIHFLEEEEHPEFSGIWIIDNPKLSICNCGLVCRRISSIAHFIFERNAEGCNSIEEVQEACLQSDVADNIDNNETFKFLDDKTIRFSSTIHKDKVFIYNTIGMNFSGKLSINSDIVGLRDLPTGFYILIVGDQRIKVIIN